MTFLFDDAWAAEPAAGTGGDQFGFFFMMAIVFLAMYFLLIRPQSKRAKEHRKMVEALGKGDEIVTSGGILGRITDVGDQFVTLEVAEGTNFKVQKHAVSALMPKGTVKSS